MKWIKERINEWRTIKQIVEDYEALDDYVNNLDIRVNELESTMDKLELNTEYEYEEKDIEPPYRSAQLTMYEFIDELPF